MLQRQLRLVLLDTAATAISDLSAAELVALQRCLMRIDEINGELQAQQDAELAQLRCSELEAERSAEIQLAVR